MATKKTAATAKKAVKKSAPAVANKTTTTVKTVTATTAKKSGIVSKLPNNLVNIVLAELVGTFVLTLAALYAVQLVAPLYVGLTAAVLVFAIGAVSGTHINPAVTFGLWSVKKLQTVLVPFYWLGQFLGAMAAVVLANVVAGLKFGLNFDHFTTLNWSSFTVELVGAAVLLFGIVAVLSRDEVKAGMKALGIGLSLTIALVVSASLLATVGSNVDQTGISSETDQASGKTTLTNVPHVLRADSAVLNPAVALAVTEKTDAQLQGGSATADETRYSRLSLEVILGTLLGAAIGANLYLVLTGRFRR